MEQTAAGWYPDPLGSGAQRFWDGEQWATTLANPVMTPVTVEARPSTSAAGVLGFVERHRFLTVLAALWFASMAAHWWWFFPLIAAGVTFYVAAKLWRRREARLAAAADYENDLALHGDPRGTFGNYPPTGTDWK